MDTSQFVSGGIYAERESFLQTMYVTPNNSCTEKSKLIIRLQLHYRHKPRLCIPAHVRARLALFELQCISIHTWGMYDHVDGGATQALDLEQELLRISAGPNRAISVAVYTEFHAEVAKCLRLAGSSDDIAKRSIARYVDNGSVRRAAELRWPDYAANVRGRRFGTEGGARGPSGERAHWVGVVMEQVGAQAVSIITRLWDETQPLDWKSVSLGCSSAIDLALGRAIFDEALALEETVTRVRAHRGSFMSRGRLCDASCTETHFNVACSRCGQDWGNHSGHTCQGSALLEDAYATSAFAEYRGF